MCDPTLILGLGGALLSGAGQVQQSQAASASAKYNAQIMSMNAKLNERRAVDALQRSKESEQQKRSQVQQIAGQQQAAFAANGLDIGFGSPLHSLIDTATMGELDALTLRRNAANEAYDFRIGASNNRAEAGLSRANAKASETAGYLQAGSTLLTGGSGAYGTYRKSRIGGLS